MGLLDPPGTPRGDTRSVGVYRPENYGAKGDGTTDDTAAVQAAFTACPAGGTVSFSKLYSVTATITTSKQVKVIGAGGMTTSGTAASGLTVASATLTPLSLSGAGSVLRDFAVINSTTATVTPTAGAGILFTGVGSGDFVLLDNITSSGFYNGIEIDDGFYFALSHCHVFDPVNYGIYMHSSGGGRFDHGDQIISDSFVSAAFVASRAGVAAIKWESGGGLKVVGNKLNGGTQPTNSSAGKFQYGVWASVADGGSTSVLTITGNSIENSTAQGVRVDQAGPSNTGSFSKVVIVGNEIAIGGQGVGFYPPTTAHLSDVLVADNVFTDLAVSIYAKNTAGITIGVNHHVRVTSQVTQMDPGCTEYQIGKQNVRGDNQPLYYDNNVGNSGHVALSQARLEFDRDIPSTTSSSTYSALWNMTMPQNSGGILDLTLSGYVNAIGAFTVQAKRTWTKATGAVTIATVGTDTTAGIVIDILFDTATTVGNVIVKLRLNAAAGGTDILGRASLVINGPMFQVRKGT